jgi:hypothetical protein
MGQFRADMSDVEQVLVNRMGLDPYRLELHDDAGKRGFGAGRLEASLGSLAAPPSQ